MEESDKHRLEGLLKARSEDLRQTRVRGRRPAVADPPSHPLAERPAEAEPAARACRECGEPIAPQRVLALPRTLRCLDCQRAAERARTST